MEFDKRNFKDNLDNIKQVIDDCDFVSIDTELTGLYEGKVNLYDTPESRYKYVKEYGMKYTVTQFGMCTFKYNIEKEHFDYCPMNFSLIPLSKENENNDILTNVDTVKFLSDHSFDFNQTWKNGITFDRYSKIEEKAKYLKDKEQYALANIRFEKLFDFEPVKHIKLQCIEFLQSNFMDNIEIDVPNDSFERYLVLNELWKEVGCINDQWIVATMVKNEDKSKIKFTKTLDAKLETEKFIVQRFKDKMVKYSENLQFSHLIKYLSDSKKLTIIHNGFLDLIHMVDKFLQPLPEEYSEFKRIANRYFPKIIDTKYLFGDDKFKSDGDKKFVAHNLQALYDLTKTEKFISHDILSQPLSEEYNFRDTVSLHNAHYDAMMTGKVFLSLSTYLGSNTIKTMSNIGREIPRFLQKKLNRVKVVHAEFGTLNLSGKETVSSRHNIFHLSIPHQWNKHSIIRHFYLALNSHKNDEINDAPPAEISYKFLYENMSFQWLNDTSLMVKLNWSFDSELLSTINNSTELIKMVPFNQYIINGDVTPISNDEFVEVKRKRFR